MVRRSGLVVLAVLVLGGVAWSAPQGQPGQGSALGPTARAQVAPRAVLTRLATPVTRAEAVDAALAAPGLTRKMRALLPALRDLTSLKTRTVAGGPVLSVATRPATGDPLPVGLEGLPWATGVRVSPVTGGALYAGEGRNYRCATATIHGITSVEGFGLPEMVHDDVTRHEALGSTAIISLNLPEHSGLYLLNFRLWYGDGETAGLDGVTLFVRFGQTISSRQRLEVTCSPETQAVVALLQIPAGHTPLDASPEPPLEAETLHVQLFWPGSSSPSGSYFGGLTVIRL